MCFNETASLVALSVGVFFSGWLCLKGEIAYGGIIFFITIMQLPEYLVHRSFQTKNSDLNHFATKLIALTIFLQPLSVAFFNTYFKKKEYIYLTNSFWRTWPFIAAYVAVSGWVFYEMRNSMSTSFLGKCGTVCRLSWFKNAPMFPAAIFLAAYLATQLAWVCKQDTSLRFQMAYFIPAMLAISIAYTFLTRFSWRQKFTYVGSIWCFLAVFAGPMYLYSLK
jgi:hypothetical protein